MAHIFISYVHEDSTKIDKIANSLRSAGFEVWIDKESILPGQRWQDSIQNAIRKGAFFLCCFSQNYSSRSRTYMNEELVVAIEELRLRPADATWFIPVKLSACDIPDRPIGGGLRLTDFQWVDLSEDYERGLQAIMKSISASSPTQLLRSPKLGIEFWQFKKLCTMLYKDGDEYEGYVRVIMRPAPFELLVPNIDTETAVMINVSFDSRALTAIRRNMVYGDVEFYRPGTGIANTGYGNGIMWVADDANNYLIGDRMLSLPDGKRKAMFHSFRERLKGGRFMPKNVDLYVNINLKKDSRPTTEINFLTLEKFILSF